MADITESSILTTTSTTRTGTGQVNEPPIATRRTPSTSTVSLRSPPQQRLQCIRQAPCQTRTRRQDRRSRLRRLRRPHALAYLTFVATSDARKATLLAEWTASKDFFELCESHNWEIHPGCLAAKDSPPRPPPVAVAVVDPRDSETPRWPPPLVPRNADHSQTVPVPAEEYGPGGEYAELVVFLVIVVALLLATGAVLIFAGPMNDDFTHSVRLYERNVDLRRQYRISIGYTPDLVFPRPLPHQSPLYDLRYRDRRRFFDLGMI